MVSALPFMMAALTGVSIDDMVHDYANIFQSGNRNAASHRWASWILSRANTLTAEELQTLFTGFCPVSGSPVRPNAYNTYLYSLPNIAGVRHEGL